MKKEKSSKEENENKIELGEFLRNYMFPTVSLIVLILMISLVSIPSITGENGIIANQKLLKEKQEEVEDLDSFLEKLNTELDNRNELLNDSIILDQYLPKDSRLSLFIDDINVMAENSGFEVSDLEGSEEIEDDELSALEEEINQEEDSPHRVFATFSFQGELESVYELIEKINNFEGLLTVQSVEYSKLDDKDWVVEMKIASYNLPQDVLDNVVLETIQERSIKNLPVIDEELLELVKERVES